MRMLYITSLSGKRINAFMRSAIVAAKQVGFDVTLACNMSMADTVLYAKDCEEYGIKAVHIDFDRNPFALVNFKAYHQLLRLMREQAFDVVHCNTPIGGVLGRICAQKTKVPYVIYMAHGFHFYKSAPLKNWLMYYPVEKFLTKFTDLLITINREDYERSKSFCVPERAMVHGVGVDLSSFIEGEFNVRESLRQELGIPSNGFVVLSVGELNINKNQGLIIDAIRRIPSSGIYYVACGVGTMRERYLKHAEDCGLKDRVFFPGFREDIGDFYKMADVFVNASFREGIPSVVLEAMASEIPVLCSRIRGHVDILPTSRGLFDPRSADELAKCIDMVMRGELVLEKDNYIQDLQPFLFDSVVQQFREIYGGIEI